MKLIYTAEDIKPGDPVHDFLFGVVVVTIASLMSARDKKPLDMAKETVATILNMAESSDISIAAKPPIPSVFVEGMK